MGSVVTFPESRRGVREANSIDAHCASATIIILPVIRVDRYDDEPTDDFSASASASARGRKRRRPASRT